MNLRQLRYVVTVADEGSFTQAAARLFVSQPTLSQQIRTLEAELGGELLERLPRGVRLTAAGASFLPDARAALAAADRARSAARRTLGLELGELEIATVAAVVFGLLPAPLRAFHKRYPGTVVRVDEHRDRDVLAEAVAAGSGDLGIGPRPASWRGPLESLGWEELVVVLPPGDPLLRRPAAVSLGALAEREWVLFSREHGLATVVDEVCAAEGFVPRAAVRTAQLSAAPTLAGAGLGPALVPANVVPPALGDLVRALRPARARELVAFTRSAWSPLAAAFLDVVREDPWPQRPRGARVVR